MAKVGHTTKTLTLAKVGLAKLGRQTRLAKDGLAKVGHDRRVVGKEGVQVPGEGVLLIKVAVNDKAGHGVNHFGRRTMLQLGLEPNKV